LLHDLHLERPLGLGLDEQAIAAAAQLRFEPAQSPVTFPVAFTLPEKHSRWHLVAVKFKTPQGASRPTFAAADYPVGPGIGLAAYEEAEILSVIGRAASATVSFDIDERGYPGTFLVEDASAEAWGPEAVMLVQRWRFHPGIKAGAPVSVPCTLSLIWGPEDFTSGAIAGQLDQLFGLRANPGITATRQPERLPGPPVIFKTEPEYTEEARRGGLEGTVWISAIVDEQGAPGKMTMDGPFLDSGLLQNSLDTIKQWRFQPTFVNGQPTAVQVEVQVDFKLSGVQSSVFTRPPTATKAVPKPKQ
jgi:protein TonB